jgi:hypothetical protein
MLPNDLEILLMKLFRQHVTGRPQANSTDEQLARVNITPAKFHGELSYTILPEA